jgi:hypothetical protein
MNDDKWPTDWPRLFGLAAYELATPLSLVQAYARFLQSPKMDAFPEKHQNIYAELDRVAARALQVTQKMRELQAFETGRRWWAGEKTEISLENVIREAIATPGRWWDPQVAVDVLINPGETAVMAHAEPLKRAVVALLSWVCGELGRKQRYCMHIRIADSPGPSPEYRGCRDSRPHTCRSPARRAFGTFRRVPGLHQSRLAAGYPNDRGAWRSNLVARRHHWSAGRVAVALTGWRRPGRNSWIWRERLGLGRSHRRQSFTPPGGVP